MFCPICSQEQISNDTRFCSRCGFLLVGVSQLIANGGAPQGLMKSAPVKMSERKRGIKQGALLTLSSFILVPLISIVTIAVHAEPFLVAIIAILTFWGGILRMLYALLFESSTVEAADESVIPAFIGKLSSGRKKRELPPADITSSPNYAPPAVNWRDTNDLAVPPGVTDETTKLLYRDK